MTRQFVLAVEAYYCLSTFFSFFVLCLILFFSCLVAVIFFFLFLFLVYFLYVVCERVPSVIFPVQRTTSGVGDRPNRHNVRTTYNVRTYSEKANSATANQYVGSNKEKKLVTIFSRLIFNPACGQLNREKNIFPCPHSRPRIWSRGTVSAVPSRVSPLILHAQAESGAYSRTPLFSPAFHHGVVSTPEKAPSGESLAKIAFQWRHQRESAGRGPLVPW